MRVSYDLLLPLYTRFKKMHTENPRICIILSVLNLAGIEFLITLSQIKKFDTLNDISINVYTNEKEIADTTHRSKEEQTRKPLVRGG